MTSWTSKSVLGLYEGDDLYIIITNPNETEAKIRVSLQDEPSVKKEYKLKPRGFMIIELHKEKEFEGKRGIVIVESDVGLIIDWGARLCKRCKRSALELRLISEGQKDGYRIMYEWVCKKCGYKEYEGTLVAVRKDGGLELAFQPAQ